MGVSKVIVNGVTKVDLTSDTVSSENLLSNNTAHNKAGEVVNGEIPNGSAVGPSVVGVINPNISFNSSTGMITSSVGYNRTLDVSVTPGYITAGESGHISLMGVSQQTLSTLPATTYMPTTADQTITSDVYLTGNQTIKGDINLVPENIAKDVSIFGVTGTLEGGTGGGAIDNDVVFIDYDGSVVYSYTAAEFAELNSLPANPTHTGLTAQGWNWSLNDAKAHVASRGKLIIGQMYITDDGNTRIYITITEENRLAFRLAFPVNGVVTINWGDGQNTSIMSGTSLSYPTISEVHNYMDYGSYVITIHVQSGSFTFKSEINSSNYGLLIRAPFNVTDANGTENSPYSTYNTIVRKIEIGSGIVSIGREGLRECSFLDTITIPSTITTIADDAFYACGSLKAVVVPVAINVINMWEFCACYSLRIISLPKALIEIGEQAFESCRNLSYIVIPDTVNYIGEAAFMNCSALLSFYVPDSITMIERFVFSGCYSLRSIRLPNGITTIDDEAFKDCESLQDADLPTALRTTGCNIFENCKSLRKLIFPSGIKILQTEIALYCWNLTVIDIPDTVTTIYFGAFENCNRLTVVTVPSSVKTVGSHAFYSCRNMQEIHFRATTAPTAGADAFTLLPYYCTIYVPTGCLSEYSPSKGYPSSLTYIEE